MTFASRMTPLSAIELWPYLSDPLLLVRFSSELQAVRVLGDGQIALGTVFEGDQRRGEREWTSISTVTAFDSPRFFEWTVGALVDPVSRWSFLVDEHALGTTVTHRVELCGGSSPMSEFIEHNPQEAEGVVMERLSDLKARMAITIGGIIEVAGGAT